MPFELKLGGSGSALALWGRVSALLQSRWLPILLLLISNVFMTVAWYGHL